MKKIIIITRTNVKPGSSEDEFTSLWKGNKRNSKMDDLDTENIELLVINGPYFYRGRGKPNIDLKTQMTSQIYVNNIKKHISDFIQKSDEVMILYHSKLVDFESAILDYFSNVNCHEFSSSKDESFYNEKYKPLAESAAKKINTNLLQEVWTHFQEDLERKAKLNLLHRCLTPDKLEKAEELLEKSWNVRDEFESLKQVKTKDSFDKNYISALTELRNSLHINH